MLFNEIIYLLSGSMAIVFLLLIYLKYRKRHLPSVEELILVQKSICEDMFVLNTESMAILNKRKRELDNEMNRLLKDYDEPDKTFH